jgi:hypothetical protein
MTRGSEAIRSNSGPIDSAIGMAVRSISLRKVAATSISGIVAPVNG